MPAISRNVAVVLSVVLLHAGMIYALNSGLLARTVELVVPVALLAQFVEPKIESQIEPQKAKVVLPPPPLPQREPVKREISKPPATAALTPLAIAEAGQASNAPRGVIAPQPAPAPTAAPAAILSAAPVIPATPPAPAAVQFPSSDADYLQNPRPPYPAASRRLNEHGTSTIRVLIGADGQPQRAEIAKSSGYTRLDQAALATTLRWRYVPGKRGGVPESMWFNVPIDWVLE